MRSALATLVCLAALGADYRSPAGEQTAARRPGATTVLPGGRIVTPHGEQHATGPGPFGLAVAPDGNMVASADGGPGRFSLTVLQNAENQRWQIRQFRGGEGPAGDWRGLSLGLAFEGNRTLYAAEGNAGGVRLISAGSGRGDARLDLNQGNYRDSFAGDLAYDRKRELLYVVDQANFRVAIFDTRRRRLVASVKTGRLPFAIAMAPNGQRIYVTNVGVFEYRMLPGLDPRRPRETGAPRPALTFPSPEQERELGSPNAPESSSLAVIDVADPAAPKLLRLVPTGLPFGKDSLGGASPSGVVATNERIFVANAHNDSITVIDAFSLLVLQHIPLRVEKLESLRGLVPAGMAFHPQTGWLLVCEAGFNSIAVVDPRRGQVLGRIPAGWFPARVAVDGNRVWVVNARGLGTGPSAEKTAPMERRGPGDIRRGSLQSFLLPKVSDLEALTARVMENNGALPVEASAPPIPAAVRHVVLIVKSGRSFDEMFGDLEELGGMAVRGAPDLARFGRRGQVEVDRANLRARFSQKSVHVTPNHRAIAERWTLSDNFYADADGAMDGHRWLQGVAPNIWTMSSTMALGKEFRLGAAEGAAPGRLAFPGTNSSVHPEEQPEDGTLWHHLQRHNITFRNYGEGLDVAGAHAGPGMKPGGVAFQTNIPMAAPLYASTSWQYPGFNLNLPDQYRATQFIADLNTQFIQPGKELPRFLYIQLPNDQMARPRASDGYPFAASYVADNDYALGRILDYLSHLPQWEHMAVFVTESDAQGGVDHVDSHRTVLLAAGPWVKRGNLSRTNASFPGLLKTILRTLGVPPLNLFDALAPDLSGVYTDQPDFTPYQAQPVNQELFDPKKAKDPHEADPLGSQE